MFGENTLAALLHKLDRLPMAANHTPDTNGPAPKLPAKEDRGYQKTDKDEDTADCGKVVKPLRSGYRRGETIELSYRSGHPRNLFARVKYREYFAIQQLRDSWQAAYYDWHHQNSLSWDEKQRTLTIAWNTANAKPGRYRFSYWAGAYPRGKWWWFSPGLSTCHRQSASFELR